MCCDAVTWSAAAAAAGEAAAHCATTDAAATTTTACIHSGGACFWQPTELMSSSFTYQNIKEKTLHFICMYVLIQLAFTARISNL